MFFSTKDPMLLRGLPKGKFIKLLIYAVIGAAIVGAMLHFGPLLPELYPHLMME